MKLLTSIRRYFITYENEKQGGKLLATIIGCQFIAFIQEEIGLDEISLAIRSSKTLKGYFIGLSYYTDKVYKMGDLHHVLATTGNLIGHLLNQWISPKVDFVELLEQSYNFDIKNSDLEFERGFNSAMADVNHYLSEDKYQIEGDEKGWDPAPAKSAAMGREFFLYKFIKEMCQ